jgi:hypothetical protein
LLKQQEVAGVASSTVEPTQRATEPRSSWIGRWWRGLGTPRQRAALLAILGVALGLRVTWCLYASRPPPVAGDPVSYFISGIRIAEGKGYIHAGDLLSQLNNALSGGSNTFHDPPPTAFYPPGYPALLGGVFFLVLHGPFSKNFVAAGATLHVVLGVAVVLLGFEIARRLFDTRVGLVAAALLAAYPNLVFHTATFHLETSFNFLFLAALFVLLRNPWRGGKVPTPTVLLFAVVLGGANLVRPNAVLTIVCLLVAFLAAGAGPRRALTQCGLVIAVVGLMMLPWALRNLARLDTFEMTSTGYGAALCQSRHLGATGASDFGYLSRACNPALAGVPLPKLEVEANRYARSQAIQFVVHHPGQEIRLWFPRGRYAFSEDHDGLDAVSGGGFLRGRPREALRRIADWYWFGIVALAAIGARRCVSRTEPRRLVLLLATASLAATPIILFGDPRYKVPATPLLALIAAVGLVRMVDRVRGTHSSALGRVRLWTRHHDASA